MKAMLSALMDETSDAVAVADGGRRLLSLNPAFLQALRYRSVDLERRDWMELVRDCNPARLLTVIASVLDGAGTWRGELGIRAADGSVYQTNAVIRAAGEHHILLLRDLFLQAAVLGSGPQHDALTGLPNHALLQDRVDQAVVTAQRSGHSVAVITLGLDHFNRINDGLGSPAGDQVLVELAGRLRGALRRSDTVARTDGDKFVLVMPMRRADDAVTVAEKLLRMVTGRLDIAGTALNVTASIGVSVYPTDADCGDGLLKRSNSAMHHAKRVGRHCYQFFSEEMNRKARKRIELEHELRGAIDANEFVLYYQPKVDIASGRIVGAEALIRWFHRERGLITPGEFIPTAEESGLIKPIGDWVLEEACRQNSRWMGRGLTPVRMSVNMAASQFHANDLVGAVGGLLHRFALPPESLELEITETMLMGNPEQVRRRLEALREIGVYISVDDFGTGYSSLSYLTRFPITTLKIDRAFIADLTQNHSTAAITRAIIGLSKSLQLEVVAEGVETDEHIDFLRENGCTTVQGFYYCRPLPAPEFEALLETGRIERS